MVTCYRVLSIQLANFDALQVYDYDWAFRDDFMGEASLQLTRIDLDKPHELLLSLAEHGKTDYLGQVSLSARLEPSSDRSRGSIVSQVSAVRVSSATHISEKAFYNFCT